MSTLAEIRAQLRWRLKRFDGVPWSDDALDELEVVTIRAAIDRPDNVVQKAPFWARASLERFHAQLLGFYAEELRLLDQLLEQLTTEAQTRGCSPDMAKAKATDILMRAYGIGGLPDESTASAPGDVGHNPVRSDYFCQVPHYWDDASPVAEEEVQRQTSMTERELPTKRPLAKNPGHGPELYNLWLMIDELQVGYRRYTQVMMPLIVHREVPPLYDFAMLIEGWYPTVDPNDCRMRFPQDFITDDLFTPAEVEAVRAYFARHPWPGATLHAEQQTWPIPCECASVSWVSDGIHKFYNDEGFDCPVKFEGHYHCHNSPWEESEPPTDSMA